jgi:hypothetical protein
MAKHADLIYIFFDPIGQALCDRTMNVIERLNQTHATRMRYFLSKADTVCYSWRVILHWPACLAARHAHALLPVESRHGMLLGGLCFGMAPRHLHVLNPFEGGQPA